ncbi:LCP family protein [Microbacterium paludicola]|uniref:LytR family transcriptional regulator n=1 Tax=Microbacterium paludicola TaxID=300019 RepID=A0A4Y9FS59_9MICO|nr:LCP family protein [Microbacterium paludicola]MBF0817231.1 LCP family protein [Microbacterium paludicola]TFU32051.1 LytR family transcriptional regulator [Microbacterium paludicola]
MRHPDSAAPDAMTRRGWWLVILGWLIPGSAQVLAGSRRLGRFGLAATLFSWTAAILLGLGLMLWRSGVTSVLFAPIVGPILLTVVQIAIAGYGVLWMVLGIDTLRLVRLVKTRTPARYGIAVLSILLMVVSGGTAAYAASSVGAARDALGSIFGQSAAPVEPSDGYYNILLLGADSGDGRDSMRFDSISVVSINADTGATTITGIPRDIRDFPFSPGPMQDLYPDGFEGHGDPECGWDGGINQLRNAAENCRDDKGEGLYPDADSQGSSPGVEATKAAAEGILGIEIPYYVFIDMHGFADLIDALGGVEIEVTERLPKGGGPAWEGQPAEEWAIGWIEPGVQRMDGDTAQWYARSRYTTSDWDRMQRQRQLQQAILAQFTPTTVLTRFQEVANAGTDLVETDLPQSMLSYFVELGLKAKEQPVTTIELIPPLVDPEAPDFVVIRQMVADALHPPAPTPEPTE